MVFEYINSRWSISKRLVLIVGLFLVPSLAQLAVYAHARMEELSNAEAELAATDVASRVWAALGNVSRDKLAGAGSDAAMPSIAGWPEGESAFAKVQNAGNARERAGRAAAFLVELGQYSGLTLDPGAETYYAQSVFMLWLPQIREAIGGMRAGSQDGSRTELIIGFAETSRALTETRKTAETLAKLDIGSDLKTLVLGQTEKLRDAFDVISKDLQQAAFLPDRLSKDFPANLEKLEASTDSTALEFITVFSKCIVNREAQIRSNMLLTIGLLVLLSAAGGLCSLVLSRGLSRRIIDLVAVMERISRKDVAVQVPFLGDSNENGAIAKALEKFRVGVSENLALTDSAVATATAQKEQSNYYEREHAIFMSAFASATERIAKSDFSHRILEKVIAEYEPIVEQMNVMMARLETAQREKSEAEKDIEVVVTALGQVLADLADGNLETALHQTVAGEFESLKGNFNSAVTQLRNTIGQVKRGTDGIKLVAAEIAQAADDLSRRTENQAASLEQTSAAIKEITATVNKAAEGATVARNTVSVAKGNAEKSGEVVRMAIDAMNAIEASSKQINQIIGVIDEIAFQTNLLALNAGVEAARAGDAGRGFAVVASEVRALAQRSAEAAKEIKGLISASTSQVAEGVKLVAETGKSLARIVSQVGEINQIVSDIASSANEQAHGLGQVNTAISDIDQVTQQNAAMVEEATAATQALSRQSDDLARLVGKFQTGPSAVTELKPRREPVKATVASLPVVRRAARQKVANGVSPSHRAGEAAAEWEEF